ncbi:MAG TPA: M20/M25/M40 family metallo-hydrolase [Bacteroidia bacterium]|nr:M20/M25/M40 family metallo-hydrolase [Bacteroidia bacterium]
MRKFFFSAAAVTCVAFIFSFTDNAPVKVNPGDNDSTVVAKIYNEALANGQAYDVLSGLCQKAPKRLSGSPGAAVAVNYMKGVMDSYGFDKVWLQPCTVPHWVRGNPESGKLIFMTGTKKTQHTVNVCALGGSQPTPDKGLQAEVVEVTTFAQLDSLGEAGVKGKFVFYNHKFNPTTISTFSAYGEDVQYRWQGATSAEKYGAVGVIVRSVTASIDTCPHTGAERSDSLAGKIPACAISTVDADYLDDQIRHGVRPEFFLKMNCQWLPDEHSFNVIGELLGSEHPEQVIVVGGHLDAWDLGTGAQDDGAGCVQSIEAVRIFKTLGIRPKHTIRCVCFMNEENGGKGGKAYADSAAIKKEKHIAAIESDAGGFSPRGFGLSMSQDQRREIEGWKPLLLPYGIYDFSGEGGGSDIDPLQKQGVPMIGLWPDNARYFDYHHTEIDIMKNVNKRELLMGAAAMSSLIYLIDKYGL